MREEIEYSVICVYAYVCVCAKGNVNQRCHSGKYSVFMLTYTRASIFAVKVAVTNTKMTRERLITGMSRSGIVAECK
jgi:hypothetical protein